MEDLPEFSTGVVEIREPKEMDRGDLLLIQYLRTHDQARGYTDRDLCDLVIAETVDPKDHQYIRTGRLIGHAKVSFQLNES